MKKFVLLLVMVFVSMNLYAAVSVCDLDGNTKIDDTDLFIILAYLQIKILAEEKVVPLDLPTVQKRSRLLLQNQSLVVSRLPQKADILEDSTSDTLSDRDFMAMLAYLQIRVLDEELESVTLDFPTVEKRAAKLYGQTLRMGKFPGMPIGDGGVNFTLTGIETGP